MSESLARNDRWFIATLVAVWAMFAAAVYLPDVGRGFVKDDFRWVDAGRAALESPANAFLHPRADFYRPLVELTFAADYAAHALAPRGYGFTNLALYVACIAALWWLCRTVDLSPAGAAIAAYVWAVNPHDLNMALVWISGRTALCLTLSALLATVAVVRRQHAWTAVFLAAALASKEEAVALPLVLMVWRALVPAHGDDRRHRTISVPAVVALTLPVVAYASLRAYSGAMTPASAPPYYHLTFAPATVLRNVLEYADRAATAAVIAVVLGAAALAVRPSLAPDRRRLAAACGAWAACGYAVTVFVPVRSSLYAVFPSVGVAIGCGAILEEMLARASARGGWARARVAMAFAAVVLAAIPVFRARNGRYVEPARLSERALRTIAPQTLHARTGSTVVLYDIDDPTSNFAGAFGSFGATALRMRTGRDVNVWIEAPSGRGRQMVDGPRREDVSVAFAVERGRIFRVDW